MRLKRTASSRDRGAVLVVVLVLMAASMTLSSAVATSAALETAMAGQGIARLRALEAAEAGLGAALRARAWSATAPWESSGELEGGGRWEVEVRLAAARVSASGPVEWRFEIESTGRDGKARATLIQEFDVLGALPGEPRRAGWRRGEPDP